MPATPRAARRPAHETRPGRWPIASDTPLDVARTLCNAVIALVRGATDLDTLKAQVNKSVEQARGPYGQTWLGVDLAAEGPWLTVAEVARLAGVSEPTVTRWYGHGAPWGRLTRHANGLLPEREVHDFLAARRTHYRTPGATP